MAREARGLEALACVTRPVANRTAILQILSGLAGAAVVAAPAIANAEVEYPNVPYLGGSDTVLVRAS